MMTGGCGNVLVVDDDEFMCLFLKETLASAGYACRSFPNGGSALEWLASGHENPDLLLSDIHMPGMTGLDLLRTVKTVAPDLPVILISGLCDLPLACGALRAGATDYLLKPVRPADLVALVSKHVNNDPGKEFELVREGLKYFTENREVSGGHQSRDLSAIFDNLGFKRFETLQHSRRVASFALKIGQEVGLSGEFLRTLELGSLLHDIGKAGIPRNVLLKPGKLDDEEWKILKMHPLLGRDLLSGLPGLDQEGQIVYSHHERFDGRGYPDQLAGHAIPLNARVFSVADALDALTSNRCYRSAQGISSARLEIDRGSGSHFDPSIIRAFDRVPDREIEAIQEAYPDVH